MADRIVPYDTGGYKFLFVFAVAPWTEKFFSGLRRLTSKAHSSRGLMTDLTLGKLTTIWQTIKFKLPRSVKLPQNE
jgi:hypothetical protein